MIRRARTLIATYPAVARLLALIVIPAAAGLIDWVTGYSSKAAPLAFGVFAGMAIGMCMGDGTRRS